MFFVKYLSSMSSSSAQQGTSEAESMGRSVLAYQFFTGLRPDKDEGGWNRRGIGAVTNESSF